MKVTFTLPATTSPKTLKRWLDLISASFKDTQFGASPFGFRAVLNIEELEALVVVADLAMKTERMFFTRPIVTCEGSVS